MIDRKQLLEDLQSLLRKTIEPDLRERSELPEIEPALKAEFETAKKAERTALNYTDWRADYITQIGVGWVLSCVFTRFLEDNQLIDPPKLSGPSQSDDDSQASLQRARDEYDLYIKANPTHSFREYILSVVDQLAKLPGVRDIFGDKNVIHQQRDWLSNDAAKVLYNFWQTIEPETGRLIHNFVEDSDTETFDTRFLGDMYQDLSEAARKKYALLQTPDFVEEFILDRTLEPALDEFGLQPGAPAGDDGEESAERDTYVKLIDPACGSGHFLLGAFPRILGRWQQKEPGTKVDVLVQRTLYSIHGVDINPFAIAIARFRLLLASLKACGIERLANAIDFDLSNLACGDSLYHGRQKQKTLGDWTDESHYFQTEDADNLKRILQEGTFHAVVANPPYIVPKDRAANEAYRQLYSRSCGGKYSLAVPFMERIFRLAVLQVDNDPCGYTGQITANSFMKREFGKKLIEVFLPLVDLTHVIDSQLAHIPGHGTPTVILFGRNRSPCGEKLRLVGAIKREDGEPLEASKGFVWQAILRQVDVPESVSEYISVLDVDRKALFTHPWSIGGGGASELKEEIEGISPNKFREIGSVGVAVVTLEDEAYECLSSTAKRHAIPDKNIRGLVAGDSVRDWSVAQETSAIFPHDESTFDAIFVHEMLRRLWPIRSNLTNRLWFRQTMVERGMAWYAYGHISKEKFRTPLSIVYSEVSTHNHFVVQSRVKVFNRTAPVINMQDESSRDDHASLVGLLNSSTGCFWLKQVCHCKGGGGIGGGIAAEAWERFYAMNGKKLRDFPIPAERPNSLPKRIDALSDQSQIVTPKGCLCSSCQWHSKTERFSTLIQEASNSYRIIRDEMIRLQEELDWDCYRLYGLIDDDLTYQADEDLTKIREAVKEGSAQQLGDSAALPETPSFGIQLGERAFEIVMARKMAAGELQTTWFERHGSTPITEIPDHWPDDYKQLVQRRIEVIESNKNIALIEQPEYKRRWNTESWDSQVERALKSWLLDRLESYFDFDGRMSDPQSDSPGSSETPPLADIHLVSVAKLADVAAKDSQFIEVANVYRDREDFDMVKLVDELVSEEHVPALPILRYKPSGLDKRAAWEETWLLQRAEDVIEARVRGQLDGLLKLGGKKQDKEGVFGKDLPADSPLLEFFSQVQVETDDEGEDKKSSSQDNFLTVDEIVRRVAKQEMGVIPVPPKYASKDMISTGGAKYWKLRGKLDVPKERWVSFPNTEGEDQTLVIAWAGYDHLQLLQAIAAYFADVQERGGSQDPRLIPLLAAMDQQIPWVKQWHNEINDDFGYALGDYFENFIEDESRTLGLTIEDVRKWEPPKKVKKKKAAKKKSAKKTEVRK